MARRVERIGLIGTGKHGGRYARHLREDFPDLRLAAVARRDPEKLAAIAHESGARPFTDWRAMLTEAELDAVIAVVPPTLHRDIVIAAARAGVPLLLEKPAAPHLADGRAMRAALAGTSTPVMVAQTLRYNAVVRAMAAARSRIGAVRSLCFTQRFEPSPLDWLDDPARSGGGMILHTGVHAFDLMRRLSGLEPRAVSCQLQRIHTRRTEDNFVATVTLGDEEALATITCSRAAGGRNGHVEVAGEGGTLVGDHVLGHAALVVGTAVEPLPVGASLPTVREVIRDFVGAVRDETPMPIPLDEGLRAVAVVDACYAAARDGRTAAVERFA
ncbi:MAG: Gfo/Idh/MocA family oxidoreductase [Deltaproteobacteria bacterium]|nr:Gfo/Idh/MocA family oxidoreductase [Deltaproteobacteria bacterium]